MTEERRLNRQRMAEAKRRKRAAEVEATLNPNTTDTPSMPATVPATPPAAALVEEEAGDVEMDVA